MTDDRDYVTNEANSEPDDSEAVKPLFEINTDDDDDEPVSNADKLAEINKTFDALGLNTSGLDAMRDMLNSNAFALQGIQDKLENHWKGIADSLALPAIDIPAFAYEPPTLMRDYDFSVPVVDLGPSPQEVQWETTERLAALLLEQNQIQQRQAELMKLQTEAIIAMQDGAKTEMNWMRGLGIPTLIASVASIVVSIAIAFLT
jgi:hypothetical protein